MASLRKFLPLLLLAACSRETGKAGVKPIGVGFDPGDIFSAPEERGGIVDVAQVSMRGHDLDLGITGFFGSSGAFMSPEDDPFDTVLGFSYLFSPALTAADEYALVSPKGPDVEGACYVQINARGPLGSFRTVDVGDEMQIQSAAEGEPSTEFTLARNPQDYPPDTTNVFLYYIGTDNLRQGHPNLPDNWAYGRDVSLHFPGALPPDGAPVASIPLSSDAADPRVGKEAGDPIAWSPDLLGDVFVSNQASGDDAELLRFAPVTGGLPSPLRNDGVVHVSWTPPDEREADSFVVVGIKLLRAAADGTAPPGGGSCVAPEALPPLSGERDAAWEIAYTDLKKQWCDPDFEPDLEIGNAEGGDWLDEDDTCSDGLDNNLDGFCDEGGCFDSDSTWLYPDPTCARHTWAISQCGTDGTCRPSGGDRGGDGTVAELLCTANDAAGEFTVSADAIADLLASVDAGEVVGAVLTVSRQSEDLITVPLARDLIGNQEDINPVRFRVAQVQYGRLQWE
jgi:hypothetical protein